MTGMDPTQLQPGYRLDRYELLCPLAYGGMASVWLARFGGRKGFERLVVVKMILPQYSQDPRFQEMFVDEARIASGIEHANVARILDVGEQEDNTFIVMEWVDGDSLSKLMRTAEHQKSRIPAGIALRICADAAAGLHAAHTLKDREGTPLGVVHRDVSPQNILISNAGSTVIIDFGVAKARDRVSQDTSAGQLKGKIRYMAPEQAHGRAIDHRADVWALGSILYEIFAGVPPYDGPNEVATLHKLTSGEPPPPLPPRVPPPVRAVIERALKTDPDARYATALELNLALETAMVEIGELTSAAVVAHYTGQLLADRKSARKRAVDAALAAARARDVGGVSSPNLSIGTPVALPVSAKSTARIPAPAPAPVPLPAPSGSDVSSRPSSGPMGYAEVPSATSNATLGSAAMEYPHPSSDDTARRRKYIGAAFLGVFVAAALVGAVLIVMSAVMRKDVPPSAAAGQPPPLTTGEPTPVGVAATATETAPAATAVTATGASTADPTPTAATATAAPATAATATAAPTTTSHSKPTAAPPATTAKKVPPPPAAPPTSTRPDRGF